MTGCSPICRGLIANVESLSVTRLLLFIACGLVLTVNAAHAEEPPADPPTHVTWEPLFEPGSGGWMVSISVSPHDARRMLVAGDMLGVGLSTDAGDSWKRATGFKSWEMADSTWSEIDPLTVWIGSMSGPYLSRDGGATFAEKRRGMPLIIDGSYSAPVEKVLFDPDQPGRLLAFGGSSRRWKLKGLLGWIWESKDGGEHWRKLTTITAAGSDPAKDAGLNIVAASYVGTSGSRLMLLADDGGVFVSEDDAKTWTPANNGLPQHGFDVGRLATHPSAEGVAYITVRDGRDDKGQARPGAVYKTEDGGRTWTPKINGLPQTMGDSSRKGAVSNYVGLAISRSDPSILYTCDNSYSGGAIYKSTDGGETWMPRCVKSGKQPDKRGGRGGAIPTLETASPTSLGMCFMTIAPGDPDTVLGVNSEYIARSRDGGKTWDDATAYRPDPERSRHWRGRGYTGWCSKGITFHPKNPQDSILTMMDAGKGWRSRDGMQTWRYLGLETEPWGGATQAVYSGDVIYMTTGQFGNNDGIYKFPKTGQPIVMAGQKFGLPELNQGGQPTSVYALPDDSSKVWATIGGKLYASTNGGRSWSLLGGEHDLGWIAGDPTTPTRMYVAAKDGVYMSEDGEVFKSIGGPWPASAGRLHVDAKGRVYACLLRTPKEFVGLWRYDGKVWRRLLDDPYVSDAATVPTDPSRIVAVTRDDPYHDHSNASGVWISADDGRTWSQQNDGLDVTRVECVAINPHRPEEIVIGTQGAGFFRATWPRDYRPVGKRHYQHTRKDGDFAQRH